MNTYGFHSIHGRAPTLATGLKLARPDLKAWGSPATAMMRCSIGGNHFCTDAPERGLHHDQGQQPDFTKGQPRPRPRVRQRTKSTPMGLRSTGRSCRSRLHSPPRRHSWPGPWTARPSSCTWAADPRGRRRCRGASYVEVLQNCNIFNDGAWRDFTERDVRDDRMLVLEHGKPLIFGKDRNRGIRLNGLHPEVVTIGENGITEADLLVHDQYAEDPYLALIISRMFWPEFPVPVGILRQVDRPTHSDLVDEQIQQAIAKTGPGDLQRALLAGETWTVE
ncbi:MAG: 2-oxoacid:ferredoxin oxidoreductase subunit beta [Chloroflexota bacterium]